MTSNILIQIGFYFLFVLLLVKPVGTFMARVYEGDIPRFVRWLSPLEKLIYRLIGVNPQEEMTWKRYAGAFLTFNFLGGLLLYAVLRLQGHLPLNPQGMAGTTPDLAFNTAWSFVTNTNWQSYGGESTMSYFTQMAGLAVQNFISSAVGMAVAIAFIRGFVRHTTKALGNFWTDTVRSVVYILLPLSLIFATLFVWQGMPQTFQSYKTASLVQPMKDDKGNPFTEQTIAVGPVASQLAIKQLGTNGGGFYNVNSAHPFENPNPLTNFLELIAILLIPASIVYTFGKMVKDTRQGWALLAAMTVIFLALMSVAVVAEQLGNPALNALLNQPQRGVEGATRAPNMEGKEVRNGIAASALWASLTTATSNGSVNSMHDSYTPLGGMVPLWLIQLGEIIYGGVGCGLYGMVIFALVAVFISGLMVGRTPEYLGKKIESFGIKMASIAILVPAVAVKIGTAIAVSTAAGKAGIFNSGAHGFSEVLYAFSQAANNNGSAFGGLGANNLFYNVALGVTILFGRFWVAIPALAIAGALAKQRHVPAGSGTLPTHTPLFVILLIGVILIVGSLTFLPSLALGPVVEHMQLFRM
jgi:K+-transporting ATPase ATPase A chain